MQMVIVASYLWSRTGKIAVGHCQPISNLEQKKITMANIIKIISSFGWPHVSLIFSLIFIIVFYLFVAVRKDQKRINELIKSFALRNKHTEEKEQKDEPHHHSRP